MTASLPLSGMEQGFVYHLEAFLIWGDEQFWADKSSWKTHSNTQQNQLNCITVYMHKVWSSMKIKQAQFIIKNLHTRVYLVCVQHFKETNHYRIDFETLLYNYHKQTNPLQRRLSTSTDLYAASHTVSRFAFLRKTVQMQLKHLVSCNDRPPTFLSYSIKQYEARMERWVDVVIN